MIPTQSTQSFCPQTPHPRQRDFLALEAREALYGGAAGGGKSSALMMGALQYVHVPGYSALLLRRAYGDLILADAMMDRARQWWGGTAATWRDSEKTWHFPSGAKVTFGYCDHEADKYRYQGAAFQYLGVDEATQFSESQYLYLLSRLRRLEGSDVPVRARLASNPGGVGHEWVKARFVKPGDPERPFIPAFIQDNPSLDGSDYMLSLNQLDPVTRMQLLHGSWDVQAEAGMFKREWFRVVDDVPNNLRLVRYWDWAASANHGDWTAGALLGISPDKRLWILDVHRVQGDPATVQRTIQAIASQDGRHVEIGIEQERGSAGLIAIEYYQRELLQGYRVRGNRCTGDKVTRAAPLSGQAEIGNIAMLRGSWNREVLDELQAFPTKGVPDDRVDALSGAFQLLSGGSRFTPGFATAARPTGVA